MPDSYPLYSEREALDVEAHDKQERHEFGRAFPLAPVPKVGPVALPGTAAGPARSDHIHDPYADFCQIYLEANYNIPNAAFNQVPLGPSTIAKGSSISYNGANRLIINRSGFFLLQGVLVLTGPGHVATNYYYMALENAGVIFHDAVMSAVTGGWTTICTSVIASAAAGAIIGIQLQDTAGVGRQISAGLRSHLTITRLGA